MKKDVVIIGAGLTGLTMAFLLKRKGYDVVVLEKAHRTGGTMHTQTEKGYVFEEGPNTGVVSNPEVAELFEMLGLNYEVADETAKKRLILKNRKWHPLPAGPLSFMNTPLFTVTDKFSILFEPFRKRGTEPDESVASLARRRIGNSFVDYAVNPFISGIYAGDPEKLVTKYALPKLYNLEQTYGSFIGGSFRKSREKKTGREKKASKKVFSVRGGFGQLVKSLEEQIGADNIICNAHNMVVSKEQDGYTTACTAGNFAYDISSRFVVSTIGAYALPQLVPFIQTEEMSAITNLNYAKVIQVAVALNENALNEKYASFGGLIPKKENKDLLGVLLPSCCFSGRAPENCATLAVYLGGTSRPDLFERTDDEIGKLVSDALSELFDIAKEDIKFMHIFRHQDAIPQYEKTTKDRLDAINKIQSEHPGLILAGNIRNGIGIADRIRQAFEVVEEI
ncbi:protoporphyrinogen oxidase [Viscerimonas tarda]